MIETRQAQTDNTRLAVGAVLIAVLVLSFGDAVIKLVSAQFPLWQIYVIRSLIAVPMLFGLMRFGQPLASLIPVAFGWTALRSILLALMWICYYLSLPHIQLSVAAAVYYTIPLFITLLSAMLTGDKVRPKAWLAVSLGFVGVLIIVRPTAEGFNAYVLLPLVAAMLYAVAMILTRTKCQQEDPKLLSMALNVTFILVGSLAASVIYLWSPSEALKEIYPFLLGDWAQFGAMQWLTMTVLALVIVLGSLFAAIAYQRGKPSTVATFDYFYLVFSALWGLLIFSEVPDGVTLFGMLLIAAGGILAVRK